MKKKLIFKSIGIFIVCILLVFAIKSCFFSPAYNYEPYENGFAITDCNDCAESMTFPSEYRGKPILKIGPIVFMLLKYSITTHNVGSVKKLQIPDTVVLIDHEAFFGVDNLEECNVGKNVREIGIGAFYGCAQLLRVNLPSSVKTIDKTTFQGCEKLTIYCPKGSYAEQYAIENNIPYVTN